MFDGLQLEDILSGISKLRNKNIAEIFYCLGYIEKWGSGIQRANQFLKDSQMKPLVIETENIHGVTVTIYFEKNLDIDNGAENVVPTSQEVFNFYLRSNNKSFKRNELEKDFQITERQARTIIEELVENKLIEKTGSGPATYYSIIESS